ERLPHEPGAMHEMLVKHPLEEAAIDERADERDDQVDQDHAYLLRRGSGEPVAWGGTGEATPGAWFAEGSGSSSSVRCETRRRRADRRRSCFGRCSFLQYCRARP